MTMSKRDTLLPNDDGLGRSAPRKPAVGKYDQVRDPGMVGTEYDDEGRPILKIYDKKNAKRILPSDNSGPDWDPITGI
jgi:hypothetical protein